MPECTCGSPLGNESIEVGWTLCHQCRKCPRCNQPVSLTEATYCLDMALPVKHARCMIVDDSLISKIKETPLRFVDLMNMIHLLAQDTSLLGNGLAGKSFDQQFMFLQDMQKCAAETSVLIRKDKATFERHQLEAVAPAHQAKKRKVEVEAQEASLPSVKAKLTKLDKFCNSLSAMGISRSDAERIFNEQQVKIQ